MSAYSARAILHVAVYEGGVQQFTRSIDKDRITVGRSETCDLVLDSRDVGRMHATILRSSRGDSFSVLVMSARGNTLLNGASVNTADLRAGDEIQIGQCRIRVLDQAPGQPLERAPDEVVEDADIVASAPAKVDDLVLVPSADGALLAARVVPVLWSATPAEMASEPRTGEVVMPKDIKARAESGLGPVEEEEEEEPVFLLTRPKKRSSSKAKKPAAAARKIKERRSKKP